MSVPGPEMLRRAIGERVTGATVVRVREPMSKRTTLRVGGEADCYVEPASEADLAAVLKWCGAEGVPLFVLGRGSNLLVLDGGIRGVVVCLAHPAFAAVVVEGGRIRCGAGAKLKVVATEARRAGLGGLEFLEGIPGSVGGALRMNAGAMGSWMFEVVERVRVMDRVGGVEELERSQVEVRYRQCPLLVERIGLGAVLVGKEESREAIEERCRSFNEKRWSTQPAAPSAGCMFKNPARIAAGRLVDELGLKGLRRGGASVSELHGNFIVNEGGASAADVLALVGEIRDKARAERGIELELEVEVVGESAAGVERAT